MFPSILNTVDSMHLSVVAVINIGGGDPMAKTYFSSDSLKDLNRYVFQSFLFIRLILEVISTFQLSSTSTRGKQEPIRVQNTSTIPVQAFVDSTVTSESY